MNVQISFLVLIILQFVMLNDLKTKEPQFVFDFGN